MARTILFLAASVIALLAGNALAQGFPSKPLTLYCPCPPNAANLIYAQEFAKIASKYLGQPMVVQAPPMPNNLGIGSYLSTSQPDGHSLFLMHIYVLRLPHLERLRVPWHPVNDFSYVIGLASFTSGIVVKADSSIKTISELIEYAKANPGKFRYGAIPGSTAHIAIEELAQKTGVKLQNVWGKFAELATALTEGRIQAIADGTAWAPNVDAGTFRLLVTFGELRSRWNAPTAKESGFDLFGYAPVGIAAPKGMDVSRIKTLHDAFNRALDDPEYASLLKRLEMVDWYRTSQDYTDWSVDQFKFQEKLIERTIGLRKY
jgi:tripartite-type tricarboxylate transporter receptor subunit TctC